MKILNKVCRLANVLNIRASFSIVVLFCFVFISKAYANVSFTSISGSAVGISSINWQWTNATTSSDVLFQVRASSGGNLSGRLPPFTNSYVQRGLVGPNTSFSIVVVAVSTESDVTGFPDGSPSDLSTSDSITRYTSGAQNPTFSNQITSITVSWSSSTVNYPAGSYYRVSIGTVVSGSSLPFTPHHESWDIDRSSITFTLISTNTLYHFLVEWSTGPGGTATTFISAATYTLAAIPPAPTLVSGSANLARMTVGWGTNPLQTEQAILVRVIDPPNSDHDLKYIKVPDAVNLNFTSDFDNLISTNDAATGSIWGSASEWGAATNSEVVIKNLIGGASYQFQVIAKNSDNIQTSTGPTGYLEVAPLGPRIRSKRNIVSGGWVNVLTTSFTVVNSKHYHSTFTTNANDFNNIDTSNAGYFTHYSTDVINVTANRSGAWYYHTVGDGFGYLGGTRHDSLGSQAFNINFDTTSPLITTLKAQFSTTDDENIASGETTGRIHPHFIFDSAITNSSLESPATGYSYVFSTGAANMNDAVDEVIETTSTAITFTNSSRADNTYYFKIRAKDTAGNWGPVSTFTFVYAADSGAPTLSVRSITPRAQNSVYYAAGVRPTIVVVFAETMKAVTITSTNNVLLYGIQDNSGNTQSVLTAISLSTDSTNKILSATPQADLNKGWLYELVITVNCKDLGDNPIAEQKTVQFRTILDNNATNIVKDSLGTTKVTVDPGTLPSNVSLTVPAVLAAAGGAPSFQPQPAARFGAPRGPAPFTGFQAPQFVSANTLSKANDKLKEVLGSFALPVTVREFAAIDTDGNVYTSNFNKSVTIEMPFADADGDGLVDGINPKIRTKSLMVYGLDETNGVWKKVPNATINTSAKTGAFKVSHFSVYAIFGAPDNDVSNVYAYPVPFKPGSGHKNITFANLPTDGKIRIYTPVGELVKEIKFAANSGESATVWDVKDSDGEELGSDVYLYIVESGDNKKTGKVMVVR